METAKSILHLVYHQDKDRIRDFREIFISEKYVHKS